MQSHLPKLLACGLTAALCLLTGCAAAQAASAAPAAPSPEASASPASASSSPEERIAAAAENSVTGQITAIDGNTLTLQPGTFARGPGGEKPAAPEEAPGGDQKPSRTENPVLTPSSSGAEAPADASGAPDGQVPEGQPRDGQPPDDQPDGRGRGGFTAQGDPVALLLADGAAITLEQRGEEPTAGTLADLAVGALVTVQLDSSGAAASISVKQATTPGQREQKNAPESAAEASMESAPAA